MAYIPAELSQLAPDEFFARAREKLRTLSPGTTGGDHVLNPEMGSRGTYRDAAVLIPVIARSSLSVLFTLRTPRLSSHAGQVSFPGGKVDATDASAAAAAVREAQEEIGLSPEAVTVLGELDPYLTGTGYRVVPVLARVDGAAGFTINHDEVAEIFEVPLSFLMNPANFQRRSRVLGGRDRHFHETEFEGHIIWGATAGIIVALHQRMFA